jgi:hypothetical protein
VPERHPQFIRDIVPAGGNIPLLKTLQAISE